MSGKGISRQDDCCKGCGKPLVRNKGEKPSHFKRRTYCDKGCYLSDPRKTGAPQPVKLNRTGAAMKERSWRLRDAERVRQRIARLPKGPVETVEQAVARGVPITRCEPAYAYPSDHMPNGSPVRPAMGKGRRAS